jgi:signal transduction histidine kinase
MLTLLAGRITAALDNARLYRVSQEQFDELTRLYIRVSELEGMKTDMIRMAAHDLRNPLAQVLGFTELLLDDAGRLSVQDVQFLQAIRQSGGKMLAIVNDVLSLERVNSNHIQLDEIVSLDALARGICESYLEDAHAKHLTYYLIGMSIPCTVRGDSAYLREAMDNLIANAIKYTPAGGTITVRLELHPDTALFEVEDTGYGVPEDAQTGLFQPFYRARTEETLTIDGTGLGLHLVKHIIERHGGAVHFRSVHGKGSTFGFTLPVA